MTYGETQVDRARLVDLLKEGELSVAELSHKYNISEPTYYNLKAK